MDNSTFFQSNNVNEKPNLTRQPDFEEFWRTRIEESTKQLLNIEVNKRAYWIEGLEVSDVSFNGFRNSRIHAVYIRPKRTTQKVPAAVVFHGYNWNTLQPHQMFKYAIQGIPILLVEVRGQNIKSSDNNGYPYGGSAGWMTLGIHSPDDYYYSYVYMDAYRSVDVLRALSKKSVVLVDGSSQGGALAAVTAALQTQICAAFVDIPFLAAIHESINVATEGPYQEINHYFQVHDPLHKTRNDVLKTLSYVDCLNFASYITCPTLVGVGLKDVTCPSPGTLAFYQHLSGRKDIRIYPEYGHELPPIHEEEKLAFLADCLL
ncbi:acetylxylan esterase [Priestia flexa]|uniref:acetylxylan esterase n=1 Tax=Priestia flexa TaxID=86664 RepID=UPI001B3243AA|nr:acetylxylan esterase [Priestia flexa]